MRRGKPLVRRSPLVARTPLKRSVLGRGSTELTRTEIRPVSRKRAAQNRAYTPLRAAFLADRPWCESPLDCGQRATEVQHRRGRAGERLLDVAWWAASCHDCNAKAETNTGWALATGWLVPIEGAA